MYKSADGVRMYNTAAQHYSSRDFAKLPLQTKFKAEGLPYHQCKKLCPLRLIHYAALGNPKKAVEHPGTNLQIWSQANGQSHLVCRNNQGELCTFLVEE